jgi:hypothetical protein
LFKCDERLKVALKRKLSSQKQSLPGFESTMLSHRPLRPAENRFATIAEALFADSGAPPADDRIRWVALELTDFLERAGGRTRGLVTLAAVGVTFLAPFFIFRVARFDRLLLKDRVRALERLERSALAAPLLAVKALLSLIYYEHPDAARAVGFDGHCMRTRD